MYKIQIRANNKNTALPPAPLALQQWQDLEKMPELKSKLEADQWLIENEASKLEIFGFEFQIVPKERFGLIIPK